jgi:hypothetical protein
VTLRIAAAVAVTVGLAAFLGYLRLLGAGPFVPLELRHLRAMKNRTGEPARFDTLSFEAFAALPDTLSVAEWSGIERRGAVMEGFVQRVLHAPDGDVHLELAPAPRAPDAPDTAYATAEITPAFRRGSERWTYARLLEAFRPNHGGAGAWAGGPRRVRLSGWLLYDVQHRIRFGERRGHRLGAWEIHPVTAIALWDESAGAFVEYPR